MATRFTKEKRKLRYYEAEKCKKGALGLPRRRPTFAAAKEFVVVKQTPCCSERGRTCSLTLKFAKAKRDYAER